MTTPECGTLIKGALFPDGKYSNDVWQLIQNIEAHNRQFPKNQKTLGWSIEGHYTDGKVTKGGFRKATVVNVVITPSPVNKSVYLHALQENHTAFAKSLNYGAKVEKAMTATPASTDLAQKTGGDAIVKENVDDKIKETAESLDTPAGSEDEPRKKKKRIKKSTTGSQSMKTFTNVEEATKHFLDQGSDEEAAETLAKSLFPEAETDGSNGAAGEEAGENAGEEQATISMLKSLTGTLGEIKDRIFESVGAGNGSAEIASADEFETLPGEDGEEYFDAAPMLVSLQKGVVNLTELVEQKGAYDHERDQAMAKALEGIAALHVAQNATIDTLRKSVTITDGKVEVPLSTAVAAILKSRPGVPVNLNDLAIASEGKSDGNGTTGKPEGVPASFSDLQKSLNSGVAAGRITYKEMSYAEDTWRGREYEALMESLDKAQG